MFSPFCQFAIYLAAVSLFFAGGGWDFTVFMPETAPLFTGS